MTRARLAGVTLAMALQCSCTTGTLGDRASCATGWGCNFSCPTGETCSKVTPNGLEFEGPTFADSGWFPNEYVQPVAVGGRETITLKDPVTGAIPHWSQVDASMPDGYFETTMVGTAAVRVQGLKPANAWLRIVDPSTSELYDRVSITSYDIASIEVRPVEYRYPEGVSGKHPLRFVVGNTMRVMTVLWGATERLVDENLGMTSLPKEAFTTAYERWDAVEIRAETLGTGSVSVTTGSGRTESVSLESVENLDEIRATAVSPAQGIPAELSVDKYVEFCLHGYNAGTLIEGVEWVVQPTELVDVVLGFTTDTNCGIVYARSKDTGHEAVVISGGGQSLTLEFDIVPGG
jgi:hypothetical protein